MSWLRGSGLRAQGRGFVSRAGGAARPSLARVAEDAARSSSSEGASYLSGLEFFYDGLTGAPPGSPRQHSAILTGMGLEDVDYQLSQAELVSQQRSPAEDLQRFRAMFEDTDTHNEKEKDKDQSKDKSAKGKSAKNKDPKSVAHRRSSLGIASAGIHPSWGRAALRTSEGAPALPENFRVPSPVSADNVSRIISEASMSTVDPLQFDDAPSFTNALPSASVARPDCTASVDINASVRVEVRSIKSKVNDLELSNRALAGTLDELRARLRRAERTQHGLRQQASVVRPYLSSVGICTDRLDGCLASLPIADARLLALEDKDEAACDDSVDDSGASDTRIVPHVSRD